MHMRRIETLYYNVERARNSQEAIGPDQVSDLGWYILLKAAGRGEVGQALQALQEILDSLQLAIPSGLPGHRPKPPPSKISRAAYENKNP